MKKILALFVWVFSFQNKAFSQDRHLLDSLQSLLKSERQDTSRSNILYQLSKAYWGSDVDTAMNYAEQTLELSEKIGFKKGIANAYNSIGNIKDDKGDYLQALEFYKKALVIREEIGDKIGIASSYNNIGNIYIVQGNYPEALKNHLTSLKIKEEIGDKKGMARSYNNIGVIYKNQGNYPEALKNHSASLKIYEEVGDKKSIAESYINIGITYQEQGNNREALSNYFAALKIMEEIKNKRGIAFTYSNIGVVYAVQGNYQKALKNYFLALKIMEQIKDKRGIAISYNNIGISYAKQKIFNKASQYLYKSLSLSKEIGNLPIIKDTYVSLARLDSAQHNFKQALGHYKLYIIYRDSLINKENIKKITQMQMQYDFDKRTDSLKLIQARKEAAEKEIKRIKEEVDRKTYLSIFISILTIIILVFRFKRKRKKYNFLFFSFTLHQAIKILGRFALLLLFKLIELVIHKPIGEITHENTLVLFFVLVLVGLLLAVAYPRIERWLIIMPSKRKLSR